MALTDGLHGICLGFFVGVFGWPSMALVYFYRLRVTLRLHVFFPLLLSRASVPGGFGVLLHFALQSLSQAVVTIPTPY